MRRMPNDRSTIPVETARFSGDGWRGEFVADTPLHEWFANGGRADRIGSAGDALVRDGSRSKCFRIDRLDEHTPLAEPLFFKVYLIRPGIQAWFKRRIGWHRTSWAWRLGWIIHNLGIDVALPQGYLVPQPWNVGKRSYFWTQWIEGARPARVIAQCDAHAAALVEDEWFAQHVAEMLAKLHMGGVYHRDMNWGNLLVNESLRRVWLIDLDSAHRLSLKPHTSACRDVARFLMEAEEQGTSVQWRSGFLDHYASLRGLPVAVLRQEVAALSAMFHQRRVRRQPPTALAQDRA